MLDHPKILGINQHGVVQDIRERQGLWEPNLKFMSLCEVTYRRQYDEYTHCPEGLSENVVNVRVDIREDIKCYQDTLRYVLIKVDYSIGEGICMLPGDMNLNIRS